ncbi:MAG TPA: hypothetical protein VEI73_03235 [Candidatus Acidoferrum sp.]|nr:hypothetical protein [Candidatus Acidoferrum sp.]
MKQKRQIMALAVLLVIAAITWWLYFRGDRPGVVTADVNIAAQQIQDIQVESPALRLDEIARARKSEYKSSSRNIFSVVAPPPVVNRDSSRPKVDPNYYAANGPKVPIPPPPPQVQPLPVKFYGFQTIHGGRTRIAFFTNGEDVFVVPEGELLMNRFRILKIGNSNLDYEDSAGIRGTTPLEEQAAPGGSPSSGGPA